MHSRIIHNVLHNNTILLLVIYFSLRMIVCFFLTANGGVFLSWKIIVHKYFFHYSEQLINWIFLCYAFIYYSPWFLSLHCFFLCCPIFCFPNVYYNVFSIIIFLFLLLKVCLGVQRQRWIQKWFINQFMLIQNVQTVKWWRGKLDANYSLDRESIIISIVQYIPM